MRALLFGVEDLKDPLIENLEFACQISDALSVAGTYLLVSFRWGRVFREYWLGGSGNAVIQEIKHTLDGSMERGYKDNLIHLLG